jgi:hypothetical protein
VKHYLDYLSAHLQRGSPLLDHFHEGWLSRRRARVHSGVVAVLIGAQRPAAAAVEALVLLPAAAAPAAAAASPAAAAEVDVEDPAPDAAAADAAAADVACCCDPPCRATCTSDHVSQEVVSACNATAHPLRE